MPPDIQESPLSQLVQQPAPQVEEPAVRPFGGIPTPEAATLKYMQEKARLNAIQNKLLADLESRTSGGNANTLAMLSQAFLAPTRGGGFGESFGAAAGALDKQQDEERKRMQELVTMRLALNQSQLAGTKEDIGLSKEQAALQMVAKVFGTSPQQLSTQLSSGDLPSSYISRVTPELMVAVSTLDPRLGDALRHAYSMGVDRVKLIQTDVASGVSKAELIGKYGPGVVAYLPKTPSPTAPAPSPEGAATSQSEPVVDTTQSLSKMAGSPRSVYAQIASIKDPSIRQDAFAAYVRQRDDEIGNTRQPLQSQQTAVQAQRPTAQSSQTQPAVDPDIDRISKDSSLSLTKKQELIAGIIQERVKNADAPWQEKVATIQRYDPAMTTQSMAELQELAKIATGEYRDALGLLQDSGWLNATAQAIAKGAVAGNYNIAIPGIEAFIGNLKLSKDARKDLDRAAQILGSQFLANVKANKGLLGVNPTDNDARLLAAPMANVGQTADAVLYWTKQQANQVLAHEKMYRSYNDYMKRAGKASDPSGYFTSAGTGYTGVLQDWRATYNTLSDNAPWRKQ